jgi:hypothetical protein
MTDQPTTRTRLVSSGRWRALRATGALIAMAVSAAAAQVASVGSVPNALVFQQNHGQLEQTIRFASEPRGYTLVLTDEETVLTARGRTEPLVRVRMPGASVTAAFAGVERVSTDAQVASPESQARAAAGAAYQRVRRTGIYPGIDVEYSATERALDVDFSIAPGANPRRIRLSFRGATRLRLTSDGGARMRVGAETLVLKKPVIYQAVDGVRRQIAGGYQLIGTREVGVVVGKYDAALPLVIAPQVTWIAGTSIR